MVTDSSIDIVSTPESLTEHNHNNSYLKAEPPGKVDSDCFEDTQMSFEENCNLSLFVPPSSANISLKLALTTMHPVQPSPTQCELPFDSSKVYFRILPPKNEKVQRAWISYDKIM